MGLTITLLAGTLHSRLQSISIQITLRVVRMSVNFYTVHDRHNLGAKKSVSRFLRVDNVHCSRVSYSWPLLTLTLIGTTTRHRPGLGVDTLHTTVAVAEWTPSPAQPQPVAPCPRRALPPVPCRRHASGSARLPCVAPGGGRRRARGVAAVRQGSCLDMPGVPAGQETALSATLSRCTE